MHDFQNLFSDLIQSQIFAEYFQKLFYRCWLCVFNRFDHMKLDPAQLYVEVALNFQFCHYSISCHFVFRHEAHELLEVDCFGKVVVVQKVSTKV